MRRTLVISAIVLVLAALLWSGSPGVWAQKGPIKMGLLVPETGGLAANGKDMVNGLYSNPIQNVYVRKVEKVDGRLQNTVIHTIPAVSQFGPYKAEDFLKNPVYSRDYPPCKHC